jgi:hypothetical protein
MTTHNIMQTVKKMKVRALIRYDLFPKVMVYGASVEGSNKPSTLTLQFRPGLSGTKTFRTVQLSLLAFS